jgi:hypothetical protein
MPEQDFVNKQGQALKAMLVKKDEMPKIEVGNHCE